MKAEEVFRNLMEADELLTHLSILKADVATETYIGESENPTIEMIKEVIRGVEDKKGEARVYQNILKLKD